MFKNHFSTFGKKIVCAVNFFGDQSAKIGPKFIIFSIGIHQNRHRSSVTTETWKGNCIQDFSQMPTPWVMPILGTTLSLLLAGGSPRLHEYIDQRHKQLGSLFKEKIGPIEAVFVSDPKLIRNVFGKESRCPKHVLPEPWTLYNKLYGQKRGIFFMDGEEWLHFRRILNKHLLRSENQNWIEKCCSNSSCKLIHRLNQAFIKSKNRSLHMNLETELYRNSIDTIVAVLLGETYNEEGIDDFLDSQIIELTEAVNSIFETTSKLMLIPATLARKLSLGSWKNFVKSADRCLHLANDLIDTILKKCPVKEDGLLSRLQKENLKEDDIKRIIVDFILAAGDTTAYSTQWILYPLSKHEQIQENLYSNICKEKEPSQCGTLKGVIREAMRLYPVAPFLTRIAPNDLVLGGYLLPKDTLIIISLYTSGRDPSNFFHPQRFWPERWSRLPISTGGYSSYTAANPYASLPFAMGARSCIGKRIADAQMTSTIIEIVRNFKISIDDEKKIEMVLRMVSVPSQPINFEITRRV